MPLVPSLAGVSQSVADRFRVDGYVIARDLAQILAIWVFAWFLLRLVRLSAQRIERSVDVGAPLASSRIKRGQTISQLLRSAGRVGVVEKITLRVVVLGDVDGTLHTIPNGEIKTVSNKTRGWSRAVVDVGVAYAEDGDRAIAVIRDEAERMAHDEEYRALLDGVPEVWGVESLSDVAAMVRMVARTQPGSQWGVAREFRRRIKHRLDREGIRSPAPKGRVRFQVELAA